MRYKNTLTPVTQIARELGVQAVVEGSVLRVENDVRISVQLIDARNDEHLWASRYNGTLDNVLQLQGEVALAVAKEVGAQLTPEDRKRVESVRRIDPEAMELYRQGRFLQRERRGATLESAHDAFQKALEIEPEFAAVHVALAENLILSGVLGFSESGSVLAAARQAAKRALEIDPEDGPVYAVLAFSSFFSGSPLSEVEDLFDQAIARDPGNAQTRLWYSISQVTSKDFDAAREQLAVAKELDPFAPLTSWGDVMVGNYSGDLDAAVEAADRLIELHPQYGNGLWMASYAYLLAGDLERSRETIEKAVDLEPEMMELVGVRASVLFRSGDEDALEQLESELTGRFESGEKRFARYIARIHLERGNGDLALDWLEKARGELRFGHFDLRADPVWEPIRNDARFQSLLRPEPSQ